MSTLKAPVALVILDGWGLGKQDDPSNAIVAAKTPNMTALLQEYPTTALECSGEAVGLPDGDYELGGQTARLSKGKMTLPDGTIAGSAVPLLAGVRLMTDVLGRPLCEAVRMATTNPARVLGLENRIGSLAEGKEATFVRIDKEWAVKQVWREGCVTDC